MNGPIDTGRLGELSGAVQGVDDTHPLGSEAFEVVLALLGQDGVVRSSHPELGHEQLMGLAVALGLQHARRRVFGHQPAPKFDEQPAGPSGQLGRQLMI